MKLNSSVSLLAIAVLTAFTGTAQAQIIANQGVLYDKSTMPGSGADYSFYGNSGQANTFPPFGAGTYGPEPVFLPDFTEKGGTDFSYVEGTLPAANSTIFLPNSTTTSTVTGTLFGNDTPGQKVEPNVVNYTLSGSTSGFNYSNFNVYVMFDNYPANLGGINNTQITLTLTTGSGTVITSKSEAVTATNEGLSAADFAEFNVSGATQGDIVELGFVANTSGNYGGLGGVSFESATVPEPGTWAMMLGGLGVLFIMIRLQRKQNA